MADPPFRIGLVQISLTPDPEANQRKALEWVAHAAEAGAQVVCLPELYRSQYFCQKEDAALFDLAEPYPGESLRQLGEVARRHGVAVVAPFFERRAPGIYHNSVAVIDASGDDLGLYRKMHIPDDPAYYEKFYFTPGDLGFRAFATRHGSVGTLICWDQWYPEAARLTALHGAQVIVYPTAIGWHPHEKAQYGTAQCDAWMTVQRGHAIANGVYVAAANRTGFEQPVAEQAGIEFWGSSFICDPQGVILAQGGVHTEEVVIAEVDPAHLEEIRRNWPFLRDRRIDAYAGIEQRYLDGDCP